VVFAAMFGHVEDASLLDFEDREAMQQAPKIAF
jgi:LemA protein